MREHQDWFFIIVFERRHCVTDLARYNESSEKKYTESLVSPTDTQASQLASLLYKVPQRLAL